MKKKFLSILIASTIIVSQAPILQTSAITLEKSTSTYENGVNLQKDMMVDGSYQGEDGALVDNIKTFKTVEAAINAIPTENTKNVVIFIKNGTYKEKLKISKPNVTLVGESSEVAVITFDDASRTIKRTEGWTEMSCAGVMIQPLDNRMYEYGSTCEGSRTSDTRRVLTDEQASQYTIENILSGWDVSQKKAELELYKKM